ncbi:hypothetical protein Tco_0649735, partial [Tanacetum coccineum]
MTDNTALLQALQAIQQQLQQQSQQLQQQSQQQIEQNTKILEALHIREQPKRDNSRYGSSSDEEEEGKHADPANQQKNHMPRIKADIPTFSGSLNIEDFLDWVSETEKYFELVDIPEESQVKYVAYKLRGAASSWWVMTSNNVTFIASFIPLIMEYLVKISKKARILELKQRHLKITVLTSNTPYPSRKIRRICACTSQKTTKETRSIR